MSYDIVKKVEIFDNKVYLTSASNNVYPHTFERWFCDSLTDILTKEGQEKFDIVVLEQYENGNFHARGSNKYTRALKALRANPEYGLYDWRCGGSQYEENRKRRYTEAYNQLLINALNTKTPKQKYVVTKKYGYSTVYMKKRSGRVCARWTYDINDARQFDYKKEAEDLKKYFVNGSEWEVKPL